MKAHDILKPRVDCVTTLSTDLQGQIGNPHTRILAIDHLGHTSGHSSA